MRVPALRYGLAFTVKTLHHPNIYLNLLDATCDGFAPVVSSNYHTDIDITISTYFLRFEGRFYYTSVGSIVLFIKPSHF